MFEIIILKFFADLGYTSKCLFCCPLPSKYHPQNGPKFNSNHFIYRTRAIITAKNTKNAFLAVNSPYVNAKSCKELDTLHRKTLVP